MKENVSIGRGSCIDLKKFGLLRINDRRDGRRSKRCRAVPWADHQTDFSLDETAAGNSKRCTLYRELPAKDEKGADSDHIGCGESATVDRFGSKVRVGSLSELLVIFGS